MNLLSRFVHGGIDVSPYCLVIVVLFFMFFASYKLLSDLFFN